MVDVSKLLLDTLETNKNVGDNLITKGLKAIWNTFAEDGGPGSGRKPGSKNRGVAAWYTQSQYPAARRNLIQAEKAVEGVRHNHTTKRPHHVYSNAYKLWNTERATRKNELRAERGERIPSRLMPMSSVDAKPDFSINCNVASLILDTFNNVPVQDGGEGSGNFGHSGRKGEVGGSSDFQNVSATVLTDDDKKKIASALDTITKVFNKDTTYFKDDKRWHSESKFNDTIDKVRSELSDNNVSIGSNGEKTALNVRIVLKDKNATIKYDKDIRSKSWKDNLNKIDDIVNVTNKVVGDCNIAQELLVALGEEVQDGGPGSGRKKGSRNVNNAIATFEANGRNSEKAKQNIIQKYAHQPASEKTFNQREQELNRVREKGQSVTRATRNAARHGTRLTPINSVDDGGPGSGRKLGSKNKHSKGTNYIGKHGGQKMHFTPEEKENIAWNKNYADNDEGSGIFNLEEVKWGLGYKEKDHTEKSKREPSEFEKLTGQGHNKEKEKKQCSSCSQIKRRIR